LLNNGPTIEMMLPQFRTVLEHGKNLVIFGFLDEKEIKGISKNSVSFHRCPAFMRLKAL
jgi:hypothetical protein